MILGEYVGDTAVDADGPVVWTSESGQESPWTDRLDGSQVFDGQEQEHDGYSDYGDPDDQVGDDRRGHGLRTRDIKTIYDSHGESLDRRKGRTRRSREKPTTVFAQRMANILGITEDEVPEHFVNQPVKSVRTNALRMPADDSVSRSETLGQALADEEVDANPLPWLQGVHLFDATDTARVQHMPLTAEGSAYIQNPSSMLPVLALETKPGDTVLDMCSAPGGKASLIASLTGNEALLTSNELKSRRMTRLKEVMELLGASATLSEEDGRHLPQILGGEQFDRVLLDAECSTEAGINFESNNPLKDWSLNRIARMARLQIQLATAAYDLLRPGGVMVYSTCSLAPEENEAVLSRLLTRRSDAILQPLEFDAEPTAPNLRSWNGDQFPRAIGKNVIRMLPTDHMEGFFLARIRKPQRNGVVPPTMTETVSLDELAEKGL